jgi:hypothetical protein
MELYEQVSIHRTLADSHHPHTGEKLGPEDRGLMSLGNSVRIRLYSAVHYPLHPALSKKGTLRPGLADCPSSGRLIRCYAYRDL